ncbi:MAG TPA: glutamate--tRNA ligase family protein [Vicinamibacterales bacterium]
MSGSAFLTRFAPSPTGHLHLGHLVNAIHVWGAARAAGGRVLLRIEDHDRERSRSAYEQSILEDLEWLGLMADLPPADVLARDPSAARQSSRPGRYETALRQLEARGLVYWCDCSRARIQRESGTSGGELRYDGRCRTRGLGPGPDRGVRVRMDPGVERFDDLLLGPQAQDPSQQCGDLLVRDRVGQWTYQFAVTVDDMVDGVTHVIRGRDLLASTGRQIRLARLLGRGTPPRFAHHPLLLGEDGAKLSKSRGDTGIRELRAAGLSPEEVLGRAAHAVGLIDRLRPVAVSELGDLVAARITL